MNRIQGTDPMNTTHEAGRLTDDEIDEISRRIQRNYEAGEDAGIHAFARAIESAVLARAQGEAVACAYPECSGNPSSCPENEGFGCCKAAQPAQGAREPDQRCDEACMHVCTKGGTQAPECATPSPASTGAGDTALNDDLALIESVLKGYPASSARNDATLALQLVRVRIAALSSPAVVPAGDAVETVDLYGVDAAGKETFIGKAKTPPKMMIRDYLTDIGFIDFGDEDSETALVMYAMNRMIDYCRDYFAAAAPALPAGEEGVQPSEGSTIRADAVNLASNLMGGHGFEVTSKGVKLLAAAVLRMDRALAVKEPSAEAVDAARYRWLRDVGDATWRPFGIRAGYSAAQADAAIDAAMSSTTAEKEGE